MSVTVPESVVETTRVASAGRGTRRMELLMEYVTPLLEDGESVVAWTRNDDGDLVAVTEKA